MTIVIEEWVLTTNVYQLEVGNQSMYDLTVEDVNLHDEKM